MAKTESTPRGLQLTFVIITGAIFLLQLGLTANTALQQYPHNANLSSYAMFFVEQMIVPVIMVIGAYLLNPRKISKLGRVFESMVITLVGQAILQMVAMVAMNVQFSTASNANDAFYGFITYQLWSVGITLVGYFAVLVYLRKTKRWQ